MALKPKSFDLGMHTEKLSGRTQQRFFTPDEEENLLYPTAYDVDFNKRAEFDAEKLSATEINLKLRDLMKQGHGSIVLHNPGAKHGIAVGTHQPGMRGEDAGDAAPHLVVAGRIDLEGDRGVAHVRRVDRRDRGGIVRLGGAYLHGSGC